MIEVRLPKNLDRAILVSMVKDNLSSDKAIKATFSKMRFLDKGRFLRGQLREDWCDGDEEIRDYAEWEYRIGLLEDVEERKAVDQRVISALMRQSRT